MICFKKNKFPQHVQHDEPMENDIDISLDLDFEPPAVEIDRYISWLIFLADTDISVSVLIISVLARTISVSASVLIEILVSVSVIRKYWYRHRHRLLIKNRYIVKC